MNNVGCGYVTATVDMCMSRHTFHIRKETCLLERIGPDKDIHIKICLHNTKIKTNLSDRRTHIRYQCWNQIHVRKSYSNSFMPVAAHGKAGQNITHVNLDVPEDGCGEDSD